MKRHSNFFHFMCRNVNECRALLAERLLTSFSWPKVPVLFSEEEKPQDWWCCPLRCCCWWWCCPHCCHLGWPLPQHCWWIFHHDEWFGGICVIPWRLYQAKMLKSLAMVQCPSLNHPETPNLLMHGKPTCVPVCEWKKNDDAPFLWNLNFQPQDF